MRRVILLWHKREPVGICIFAAPSAQCRRRSQFFGLHHPTSVPVLHGLNRKVWLLQRVVLHPSYRGAGIAAKFIRRACELCPVAYVETLSAMGQINPVFERAGFIRVGPVEGKRKAAPRAVYYVWKNKNERVA